MTESRKRADRNGEPGEVQPTRILCPRDSPGKNTGMGCCALPPPGHLPHPRTEPNSGVVVGPCHDHGRWRVSTDHFSFLSGKEARGSEGRENEEGGGWRFDEEGERNQPVGRMENLQAGKGWRVADQRKGPHRREVTVVDVNGAQTGSAGHEQVQAWAQRELELGQGSKTECRGLRKAGWPRERWPQHMSEAEPFWWKSDDRGCPGPLKRLHGLRFSPPAKSQRSPGNRGSELVGEEEGTREREVLKTETVSVLSRILQTSFTGRPLTNRENSLINRS